MTMSNKKSLVFVAALAAVASFAAQAQSASTFRCVGADGKKYYGNTIPPQCYGRLVEQLNSQGMVVKRIDPDAKALSEKEMESKLQEKVEKDKREAAVRESTRRDRALLATYTSEKDIDEARERALEDNNKAIREVEERIAEIRKRQADYEKELEFYTGKNQPPAKLTDDILSAQTDLKAKQELLEVKKREVSGINAKYDEDKKRYADLAKRR
jgi:chromosome segregation ATPase